MRRILFLLAVFLLAGAGARAEQYRVSEANQKVFRTMLNHLQKAYEKPFPGQEERIEQDLVKIRTGSEVDYLVARSIAEHWKEVYLNRDYQLVLYKGEESAEVLKEAGIPDGASHAFVVLGYQLKNGMMTDELKGRCEAAAAAARAFPDAILVCSGGATGSNNPQKNTEAGEMKKYLVSECGIDASRIFIDEEAMTTLENAENTFTILREQGIRTITIVTSSYHQRWGQVLYNAMAELTRQTDGTDIWIVGNYSFDIEPENEKFRRDDRFALQQFSTMLGLPR